MSTNHKTQPMKVGIIGVGNISPAYIKGCRMFDNLELVACADIDVERAKNVAAENNIPYALSVEEILATPEIDVIVNLTVPKAHAAVSQRVIDAGKHVYSEKPLATTFEDGRAIIAAAEAKGVRVGCAPDTFMFGPHQAARQVLEEGAIGKPVAAVGFFANHGPEKWHPNPEFFYKPGAGPMLDMGPYYITCLINLLGPILRVSGAASTSFPERIDAKDRRITVEVPTHYTGILEFASGAVATVMLSFDVWAHRLPNGMEVYGEKGTLAVPDPNGYKPREVRVYKAETAEWTEATSQYPDEWARGIGLADMAYAISEGRPHRASGALALHVLEVLESFPKAQQAGNYVTLTTTCERPEALTPDFARQVS